MYALLALAGRQYKVTEGQILVVPATKKTKVGDKLMLSGVVGLHDGNNLLVDGQKLKNMGVQAEVVAVGKGEKFRVATFKAKSRFRKVKGFRELQSTLKIIEISTGEPKNEAKTIKRTRKPQGKVDKE